MMGWMTTAILLLGLQCITTSFGLPHQFPPIDEPANDYFDATSAAGAGDENIDMDKYVSGLSANMENRQEEKLLRMGNYLAEMLLLPWDGKGLPLLYVEEAEPETLSNENLLADDYAELSPRKRSRFYRKYPWKRQNPRQNYDAENRYLCQPTREDVYRLLVALHDSRQGGQGRNINFCNRKRPAKAIFTNIRFMG